MILGCFLFFLATQGGYAMQPPPPPLDIAQFKLLVAEADIIVIGKINESKETDGVIEATLGIEKLLKGKAAGKTIAIKEIYKPANFQTLAPESKDEGGQSKAITASIAGPATYHGKYKKDGRILVLLQKIEGTGKYKPLGSGTYNKYLCEFIIENDGIKSIEIDYFRFAEDLGKYIVSENKFTGLIKKLLKSNLNKKDNND
jgi:hypothetical protein